MTRDVQSIARAGHSEALELLCTSHDGWSLLSQVRLELSRARAGAALPPPEPPTGGSARRTSPNAHAVGSAAVDKLGNEVELTFQSRAFE